MSSESKLPQIDLSFDLEFDGESPEWNSLREIGIVATDPTTRTEVSTFSACLKRDDGAYIERSCQTEFWDKHPDLLARINAAGEESAVVFVRFDTWLRGLAARYAKIRWMARPASADWIWLKCWVECHGVTLHDDELHNDAYPLLGYRCVCISERIDVYAQLTGSDRQSVIRDISGGAEMPHVALEDARIQARMFYALEDKFAELAKRYSSA